MPIISGSSGGSGGLLLSYTEVTTNVTIASTTEATGTAIVSPPAIIFDGAAVWCEFFCSAVNLPTAALGNAVVFSLFEGATQITRIARCDTQETTSSTNILAFGRYHFTPTLGSHTYTITAFASSTTGAPAAHAGAGGTGNLPPMYAAFFKA